MGKKITELNAATNITNGTLLFVGDPTTGSLKKISLNDLSKHINNELLEPGTLSFTAYDNLDIKAIKFSGATETLIGVGTTDNIDDIYETGHLPANDTLFFEGIRHISNGQTIYFNGVQSDTLIKIFKL